MGPEVRAVLIAEGSSDEPLAALLATLAVRAGAREAAVRWANFGLLGLRPGRAVGEQARCALEAFPDVNLVFVHRDADGPSGDPRRAEIASALSDLSEPQHVAVVPVQETEAWLLASLEPAIRSAAGQPRGRTPLDLPPVRDIERRARPKELLQQIVESAQDGLSRRHRPPFVTVRRLLLERLDLDGPVRQIPAFGRLCADLEAAVARLR
jgi:hypothetical protein